MAAEALSIKSSTANPPVSTPSKSSDYTMMTPPSQKNRFSLCCQMPGSLADLSKHKKRMSESFLVKVARQVLEGLKYLHGQRIVYRDIKPSNLLISKNLQAVKIADFVVSRIVSQTIGSCCDSYVGTCAYMSPERFDPQSYGGSYNGYAGDILSLGLSMLECYSGHFPFQAGGKQSRVIEGMGGKTRAISIYKESSFPKEDSSLEEGGGKNRIGDRRCHDYAIRSLCQKLHLSSSIPIESEEHLRTP